MNSQVLAISCDPIASKQAWGKSLGGISYPLVSDFWPHGAVAKKFGVLRSDGVSERALFFIDQKGVIRDIVVSDINKRPDLEQCALALDKLDKR